MEKLPQQSGIYLQPELFEALLSGPQKAHWLAFRPEDFLAMGGSSHTFLEKLAERYPLSMTAPSLSVGSAESVNETDLQNIVALVERYNPRNISAPLGWCRWQGCYIAQTLPIPLTYEALDQVIINLRTIQNALGRRVLATNMLSYINFVSEELTLDVFLNELVRHSGCGIALNLTALYADALNRQRDPFKELDSLPLAAIKEVHLCGQTPLALDDENVLIVEALDEPVSRPVWQLYRQLLNVLPKPAATLIYHRSEKPNLKAIFSDALRANEIIDDGQNKGQDNNNSRGFAL